MFNKKILLVIVGQGLKWISWLFEIIWENLGLEKGCTYRDLSFWLVKPKSLGLSSNLLPLWSAPLPACSPLAPPIPATLAALLFLEHTWHIPVLSSLHWLFLLLEGSSPGYSRGSSSPFLKVSAQMSPPPWVLPCPHVWISTTAPLQFLIPLTPLCFFLSSLNTYHTWPTMYLLIYYVYRPASQAQGSLFCLWFQLQHLAHSRCSPNVC